MRVRALRELAHRYQQRAASPSNWLDRHDQPLLLDAALAALELADEIEAGSVPDEFFTDDDEPHS